jgi:hypothetical protein
MDARMTEEEVRREDREKLAAMMIRLLIATGHGDTIDDLLGELEAAVEEMRKGAADTAHLG